MITAKQPQWSFGDSRMVVLSLTTTMMAMIVLCGGTSSAFTVTLLSSTTTSVATRTSKMSDTALNMATWSDSKAVKDYQDFLSSGAQEIELPPDGPSVVLISPSESSAESLDQLNPMARALLSMGTGEDVVVTPYQELPQQLGGRSDYPIYITLNPTEISPFIQNLDESYKDRAEDFCFFSGGLQHANIEENLQEYGFCRDSMTQILMTGMAVDGSGAVQDRSVRLGSDAIGEEKWAGEVAACGKWKGAIAERLNRNQIRCNVDFYRDWRRRMWERNIIDSVFHLVGAVRKDEPTSLADVARYYEDEVSDIVWEVSQNLRGWKALTLTFGFEERMFGVAETESETQCVLIDELFPFLQGNKVFLESPMLLDYLWYAKTECGLLQSVDLPPRKEGEGDRTSGIFRKGNLRADGVI